MTKRSALAGAVLALTMAGGGLAQAADAPCDRACLKGVMDSYLASLVAHDPSRAPLAKTVKFTENTMALKPGQGLWATASGVSGYRVDVADPAAGEAGFMGRVMENGNPLYYAVRLKVAGGKITEIESIAARNPPFSDPKAAAVRPMFGQTMPQAERVPRAQMIAAVDGYFDSIEHGDGKVGPFADDCQRVENGLQTTGVANAGIDPPGGLNIGAMTCQGQISTRVFDYLSYVKPRRIWLVDEAKGMVFGVFFFTSDGTVTSTKLSNGEVRKVDDAAPNATPIVELFRIKNGQLSRIEAVFGARLPFGLKTGWE